MSPFAKLLWHLLISTLEFFADVNMKFGSVVAEWYGAGLTITKLRV